MDQRELIIEAVAVLIGDYAPVRKWAALTILKMLLPANVVKTIMPQLSRKISVCNAEFVSNLPQSHTISGGPHSYFCVLQSSLPPNPKKLLTLLCCEYNITSS